MKNLTLQYLSPSKNEQTTGWSANTFNILLLQNMSTRTKKPAQSMTDFKRKGKKEDT